jgi:hypothetical protein
MDLFFHSRSRSHVGRYGVTVVTVAFALLIKLPLNPLLL